MNPLSLLTGWYGYAAAAAVGGILLSTVAVGATALWYKGEISGYKITIADMKTADANAEKDRANLALTKFEGDVAIIHNAALLFGNEKIDRDNKFSAILKGLKSVQTLHPLPAACVLDADRLRNLAEAISITNAAVGGKPSR